MLESIKKRLFTQDRAGLNLRELQQQLAGRLILLVGGMAGAVALAGFSTLPDGLSLMSLALIAIALAALSWGVARYFSRSARLVFVVGMAALYAAALWIYPQSWLPFLMLPLIFIAAILARGMDLAIAVCLAVYTSWLGADTGREYAIVVLIFGLVLTIGIARLAMNTLYNALNWAWETQQEADALLAQSRDRQAELSSALKSLELASYQLETANQKLFVARRQTQEAQRAKEQFAANISHELRTPLNVILGFSEMMYISPDVYGNMIWPTPLRQDVYQIYRSSRHLLAMIDDVLELSRFELARFNLNKEPTEVATLLQNAVEIVGGLFRDRPVQLSMEIEPGLPAVEIDRTRIRQVIINLVTNARKYTKAGQVCVAATAANGEIIISVSDTGPGIPKDKLPYIFDAFYQVDTSLRREQGGAGLGLAISKQFVEAHEGRIWAESCEGAGTTVCFALPLPDGGARTVYPRETESREPAWQSNRQSIVVLDPDPAVVGLLSRHLEDYEIVPLEEDEHLGERLAQRQPRIVIRNVPPGRDKLQTAQVHPAIRSNSNGEQPVAEYVPTYVECSLPSRTWIAADLAINACLTKPITADQLYGELDRLGNIHDILVIDDDRGFAQLVERMFAASRRDLNVRLAFDGREGLEAMRESKPDVVFLDLAMPVMDGFHVLGEIEHDQELAATPIILLTVTSYAEDALLRHGSQMLISRPNGLRLAEVLRCLNAVASAVDQPQVE